MRIRTPHLAVRLTALLSALGLLAGCFVVADVDRFQAVGSGGAGGVGGAGQVDDPTRPSSLELTLRGMKPHFNQLVEFMVVDAKSFVQCRGVIDPISGPALDEATFHLRNAIPAENGPYHLDLYGDLNGSGTYDGLPTSTDIFRDHAWRIDPLADFPEKTFPHVANVVRVVFQHNTQFTDIGQPSRVGLDVALHFPAAAMTKYVGDLVEVRVVQAHAPSRTVGLYRNPKLPATDVTARIRGIAEVGDDYQIEVYVDSNGNGQYDDPAATGLDGGWRNTTTVIPGGPADPTLGIDYLFDPTQPSNVSVGEP